jgi:GNAT superfamily N-acetyltransferase
MNNISDVPSRKRDDHPFKGCTREKFLGSPKITSGRNASSLQPKALPALGAVDEVPFPAGRRLTAKYSEAGAAVFDGEKVIASYNFGDTLTVAKGYRRQGIGSELVYQWRMRHPEAEPARHRTKKSQALQEKVWDRIEREIEAIYAQRPKDKYPVHPCP